MDFGCSILDFGFLMFDFGFSALDNSKSLNFCESEIEHPKSEISLLCLYIDRWHVERYAERRAAVAAFILAVGGGIDNNGLPFYRVFAHQHLYFG